MNNLKIREAFQNQCGQCVIIDINNMEVEFLQNITNALKHILAVGCSIRGGNRIPAFELSILTKVFTKLYELNIIRGNFYKIAYKLNSLINYCKINENTSADDYKDILFMAINSAVLNFKSKLQSQELKLVIPKIEITIISMKDYEDIGKIIELFLTNVDVTYIYKINLLQIQSPNANTESNNFNHDGLEADNFVKNHILDGENYSQFQNYFKQWLTDKSTEIAAILHFPSTTDITLKIKCDTHECMLNPLSLPFGNRFHLQVDTTIIQFNEAISSSNIPVFQLNITSRINSSSICESSIHGLPFCLAPSKSWRLSYEEQQLNEEYFIELCRQLGEEDKYLLARLLPSNLTDIFLPYFILIPGNCCFLVKSFASNDIAMPWKGKNNNLPVASHESSTTVYKNLQNLENIDNINERTYDSGLLTNLVANLATNPKSHTSTYFGEKEQGVSKKRRVLAKNFQ